MNRCVPPVSVQQSNNNPTERKAMMSIKNILLAGIMVAACISAAFFPTNKDAEPPEAYLEYCANCHGTDLRGGNAQSLLDGVWQFGAKESYIFRSIKFGIPHLGMPSYEESLSDSEIRDLVEYVLNEEKRQGITRPPLPEMVETQDYKMKVEQYATGLEIPWSIAFVDGETALITERPGRLRIVQNGILNAQPVEGMPEVLHEGQGGLLDVAVDPDFASNGWIYLSYSHEIGGSAGDSRAPAMTRIVRGHLEDNKWKDQQVVFEAPQDTYRTTRHHYGCRIVFDRAGYLYFAIGDRGAQDQAQDITRPNGKVHRIRPDGSIPEDNPFVHEPNAQKSIYTYGNRNPQGLAVHPETGNVWETEHGPLGGDELNLIIAGTNYGWPVITYGRNYNGTPITNIVKKEGMAQPVLYWKPSIAACGLDFYDGTLFPKWKNRLLAGALKYEEVQLLHIDNQRVMHTQTILKNLGRVRDVCTGPEGAIYVVLNSPGTVIRLTPM
jgi:glucose/arabinose dehydrogenase